MKDKLELEYKVKQLTIKNGNLISLIKDIACNVGDVLKAAERMHFKRGRI